MENSIEKSEEKIAPLIAVVDDDESMREALQSLLKSVEFRTAVFASADEFLNTCERYKLDCLILDQRMPGMSGLQLQQKLIEENSRVPIVFLSAHSEPNEKAQAIAAGAIDFLIKPFSEESLLGAVSLAIKSKNE